MPLQQVFSREVEIDAITSAVPLNYSLSLPNLVSVPLPGWWETGLIHLSLVTQTELFWDTEPNDQTYNNPTEYRGGTVNFQKNGYSYRRDYLSYARQLYDYNLPPITVAGSLQAAPMILRSTDSTFPSHAYSIGDVKICGTIADSPDITALPSFLDGTIPAGAICLRIQPGQMELKQINSTNAGSDQSVAIDLDNYFHSYTISGIVRGGFRLVVRSTMYYLLESSPVADTSTSTIVRGIGAFPVYGYSCAFGQPAPDPLNPPCPPALIQAIFDDNGQYNGTACITPGD